MPARAMSAADTAFTAPTTLRLMQGQQARRFVPVRLLVFLHFLINRVYDKLRYAFILRRRLGSA